MTKQLSFFPPTLPFFGGALLYKKQHALRALSFKHPIHLVLRSTKAKGRWAFMDYRNKPKIEHWVRRFSKKHGLKIYRLAVNWDHIHLVGRFHNRQLYRRFIRALTGAIPRSVMKFIHPEETFWDFRPFSRIVNWGKDFVGVCEYLLQNELEAHGHRRYKPRKDRYTAWLINNGALGPKDKL